MRLYHVTPRRNLPSIREHGILGRLAKDRLKVAWVCAQSRIEWALLHCQKRHGCRLGDLVAIEVKMPRAKLRRFARGLWNAKGDVPPECLGEALGVLILSATGEPV